MGQRITGRLLRYLGATACAAIALGAGDPEARAQVVISIDSGAVAAPGQLGSICVSLQSGGVEVAATENEIHWDTSCLTPVMEGCRANPAHGKSLFSVVNDDPAFPEPFLKAIVISFENSDPIADGELYCCNFVVDLEEDGACCELRIEEPLVSSPDAEALATTAGPPGLLCLDSSATPNTPIIPDTRTPTWTPSPRFDATATPTVTVVDRGATPTPAATRTATLAIRTATPLGRSTGDEDDGCRIVAPRRGDGGLAMLLLPTLLLWWRRAATAMRPRRAR